MKKGVLGLLIFLVFITTLGFVFKSPIIEYVKDILTADMFVTEDTDSFDPGLEVGDVFPAIDAQYMSKNIRSINAFAGSRGTVFVVSRSLDWCPYCMKQMSEINTNLNAFEQAGIAVIGLTYDSEQNQQAFKDSVSIRYPILSDNAAASVKVLGLLNEKYVPGDEAYGIGHPGAFVIDTEGVIVGKVFIENYALRVDALSLLKYAESVL